MFYFSYFLGVFYLIREFNDLYDYEIVDIIPFYDVRKIEHWCKCANIKFPYEFNDCVSRLLSIINFEGDDEYCLYSFDIYVTNGDIKLYCKEKRN